MPDLRDDLGRLADFVGEPRGLDDLAAARRRRERRRRAEGLIGGIAVVLATATLLVSVRASRLSRHPSITPGDSTPPVVNSRSPTYRSVPENWADSTGADALAASAPR